MVDDEQMKFVKMLMMHIKNRTAIYIRSGRRSIQMQRLKERAKREKSLFSAISVKKQARAKSLLSTL